MRPHNALDAAVHLQVQPLHAVSSSLRHALVLLHLALPILHCLPGLTHLLIAGGLHPFQLPLQVSTQLHHGTLHHLQMPVSSPLVSSRPLCRPLQPLQLCMLLLGYQPPLALSYRSSLTQDLQVSLLHTCCMLLSLPHLTLAACDLPLRSLPARISVTLALLSRCRLSCLCCCLPLQLLLSCQLLLACSVSLLLG